MSCVDKRLFLIVLNHPNDYERLRYYPSLIGHAGNKFLFVFLGQQEISLSPDHSRLDLSWRTGFFDRIRSKFNFLVLQIYIIFYRVLILTCHVHEPDEQCAFKRLIKIVRTSPNGKLLVVPHGITSYRLPRDDKEPIKADIVLYATQFDLNNSIFEKFKNRNVELFRIGDLKLFELNRTTHLVEKDKEFKILVMASNLNQFNFTDEQRLNCILEMMTFATSQVSQELVMFRPHPRFKKFADIVKEKFPLVTVDPGHGVEVSVAKCEYVIALTSTIVFESLLINPKTLLVEPNEMRGIASVFDQSIIPRCYVDELSGIELSELNWNEIKIRAWINETLMQRKEIIYDFMKKL
jgi:hypothetical protein